jgi:transcriptional regulator with XRE-family HTH domain
MSVYFSDKFKQLRKAHDLTQEQIAVIFHVSPQSVSRWETGVNYPDVELLPHIAGLFKVTVDDLLGTDEIRNEEKAAGYIKDIRNLLNSGKSGDAIALARKATKEYPLHTVLHYLLVQAMSAACDQTHKDEIIATNLRIINLSDYKSSLSHRVQLIRQYAKWGMKAEAQQLLDSLPDEIWHSQEPWLGLVLEGDAWEKNQRNRISRAKYLLQYYVDDYIEKAGIDIAQKLACKHAKMQIEQRIDTITGQETEPIERAFDYIGLAELYVQADDAENTLVYVEKATQDAMYHTEQMDKTNDDDGGNYLAWETPRNLPWILLEDHLMKPAFDSVRGSERFIKCFELLKSNSRELK